MPQPNAAFNKALALLAHPLSLAALALLLVNDHLLRPLWPSWWTGKLGDLAWLFFVPFGLAALLACVIPTRADPLRRERWIFGLAYVITGLAFSLVKLLPTANALVGQAFYTLTGAPPSLVLDPSDLLALPALAASVWLWRSAPALTAFRPRALVIIPLAALLLMADAAAPDPGMRCFQARDGQILASAGYQNYASTDGGLTWQPAAAGESVSCSPGDGALSGEDLLAEWQEAPGPEASIRYRYQAGVEIQRSTDAGQTWQTVQRLDQISDAERMYYTKSRPGNPNFEVGPLHALADPATGNMLFAMGHQGVLVYTPADQWVWAAGSEYQHIENFPTADAFSMLLGGMLLLAVELAFIIYCAIALRWTRHWLRILVLVIAALGWLAVTVIFPPAASTGYIDSVYSIGILAVAVLLLPLAVEQTVRLARRAPRAILPAAGFGLLGGLLFFLPYVLWLYSTLPAFFTANMFSLALAAAVLVAGFMTVRGGRKIQTSAE